MLAVPEYHAKALERFTEMYRAHDGIFPDGVQPQPGFGAECHSDTDLLFHVADITELVGLNVSS